jgi:hypothetical protein
MELRWLIQRYLSICHWSLSRIRPRRGRREIRHFYKRSHNGPSLQSANICHVTIGPGVDESCLLGEDWFTLKKLSHPWDTKPKIWDVGPPKPQLHSYEMDALKPSLHQSAQSTMRHTPFSSLVARWQLEWSDEERKLEEFLTDSWTIFFRVKKATWITSCLIGKIFLSYK